MGWSVLFPWQGVAEGEGSVQACRLWNICPKSEPSLHPLSKGLTDIWFSDPRQKKIKGTTLLMMYLFKLSD